MQQRVAGTNLWLAQQVTCVLQARLACVAPRLRAERCSVGLDSRLSNCATRYTPRQKGTRSEAQPAVVLEAADEPAKVWVKLLRTGDEVLCNAKDLSALREKFVPGDAAKRAMLNGEEEDAEVRRSHLRCASASEHRACAAL